MENHALVRAPQKEGNDGAQLGNTKWIVVTNMSHPEFW